MAKNWYPVIDYLTCIECGTCVSKCPHNVYDKAKAPSPVVRRPEDCVDRCHGCGNRCPVGAITYVGDDTGWTPPNGNQESEEACCSCGCESASEKKIIVEYNGEAYEVAPKEMLAESILQAVFGQSEIGCSCGGYELPENLKSF